MSLEDEIRAVLTDERRGLPALPDVADGIRNGIRRRRHMRTAIGAAAGVFVVLLAVGITVGHGQARSTRPGPGTTGPSHTNDPSANGGVVPWIDVPPPAMPSAPQTNPAAPPCTASDLATTATYVDHLGISQTDAADVSVRNVGQRTCEMSGRPSLLTGAGTGHQPVATTAAPHQSYMKPGVMAPGQAATVRLAKTIACNGGVGKTETVDHLALSVAGTTIPITGLVLAGTCPGVSVSPWFTLAPTLPDPYQGLSAQIIDVGTTMRGATMRYVVALTNGSTATIAFATCPGYTESIWKAQASYELNCPSAIQPGQTVRFEMRIMIPPDVPPGIQPLGWRIVGPDYIDADTVTNVEVGPAGPATSTSSQAAPACTTDQLKIQLTASGVAAGTWSALIEMINLGRPCTMSGYPQVDGVTATGVSTPAVHDPGYMNGLNVSGVPTFVLDTGQRAGIDVSGTDNPTTGSHCSAPYTRFRVAPPGSSGVTTGAHLSSLGTDAPSCSGIRVSAVHPIRDFAFAGQ